MDNTAEKLPSVEVIANLSNDEYHACDAFSSSQLKDIINHPPAYFHAKYIKKTLGRVETDAMRKGTAIHTAWMEPDKFASEIAVMPDCDRRTKIGKAIYSDFMMASEGKTVITADQYSEIQSMRNSLNGDRNAKALLKNTQIENSLFWTDQETGLALRIRPDIWRKTYYVADLKSSQDASIKEFEKTIFNFGYHISAAMYLDGVSQLGEEITDFIFIVVESKPPYLTAVYTLSDKALEVGRLEYRRGLRTLAECLKDDKWPGHNNDEVTEISLPGWVIGRELGI